MPSFIFVYANTFTSLSLRLSSFTDYNKFNFWKIDILLMMTCELFLSQENDSKRSRAVKKAHDERELMKQKDKDIERYVNIL